MKIDTSPEAVAKMSAVLRDQASLSRDLRQAANMHNAADWMDTLAAQLESTLHRETDSLRRWEAKVEAAEAERDAARAERDKLQAELIGVLNRETASLARWEDKLEVARAELARVTVQLESTLKDRAMILAERDRTFALMLKRAKAAEAQLAALVEAAEDAEYDLLQWLECHKSLTTAGFNMDGTAEVTAKLTAALSHIKGAKTNG